MPELQSLAIGIEDVEAARERIRGVAWRTPLVPASREPEEKVHVKLECLQRTGSFKIRGAWNRMAQTTDEERERGFVTVSAGNHGQAVAWSARALDAPCTVWVPVTAVERKVRSMEAMGATVRRMPHDEIMQAMTSDVFAESQEGTFIHPFGDPAIIAGQATIGLEILDELPEPATILVPVGGGGLSTGIATAVKARRPEAKVFGVQAANAAPLAKSWSAGRPERTGTPDTIADGIGASVVFDYMFPHVQRLLDGVYTATEDGMRDAIRHLASESHVVAEAAGAASLAVARAHQDEFEPPVVAVVSGGNIDPALLAQLLGPTR